MLASKTPTCHNPLVLDESRLESATCKTEAAARTGDSKLPRASDQMALHAGAIFFMPLPYLPHQGEILVCDFDDSAVGAEMIKRRPVVVVSRHESHRAKLCTVVALSTTPPKPQQGWHHHMPQLRVTGWAADNGVWAKCDMLATVSLDRLNKPYIKRRTGRQYIDHQLPDQDMQAILCCIRYLLKIS